MQVCKLTHTVAIATGGWCGRSSGSAVRSAACRHCRHCLSPPFMRRRAPHMSGMVRGNYTHDQLETDLQAALHDQLHATVAAKAAAAAVCRGERHFTAAAPSCSDPSLSRHRGVCSPRGTYWRRLRSPLFRVSTVQQVFAEGRRPWRPNPPARHAQSWRPESKHDQQRAPARAAAPGPTCRRSPARRLRPAGAGAANPAPPLPLPQFCKLTAIGRHGQGCRG